jgi:hypothetical protein
MKSAFSVTCQCGEPITAQTIGTEPLKDTQCPSCKSPIWFVAPLGNEVGLRIMNRAWNELRQQDFTLTIVLSAMAVECELAYFYIKWKTWEFAWANDTHFHDPVKREEYAEEWRNFRYISRRFDEVSQLLTGKNFDSFLQNNGALFKAVENEYPTCKNFTSWKEFFRQELFDRRNKIVHRGEIDFQQAEGKMCFALATALFHIIKAMDMHRIKVMDSQLNPAFPSSKAAP